MKPSYQNCRIVFPTPELMQELALNMRDEDRAEVELTYPAGALKAIEYSVMGSRDTFAALAPDGRLICIGGVAPHTLLVQTIGSPWLLTTAAASDNKKSLLWYTKLVLEYWRRDYKLLENFVDARYTQALRWASWAGFKIEEARSYGPRGIKLCRITMEGY